MYANYILTMLHAACLQIWGDDKFQLLWICLNFRALIGSQKNLVYGFITHGSVNLFIKIFNDTQLVIKSIFNSSRLIIDIILTFELLKRIFTLLNTNKNFKIINIFIITSFQHFSNTEIKKLLLVSGYIILFFSAATIFHWFLYMKILLHLGAKNSVFPVHYFIIFSFYTPH